jgi:hypothetical protein
LRFYARGNRESHLETWIHELDAANNQTWTHPRQDLWEPTLDGEWAPFATEFTVMSPSATSLRLTVRSPTGDSDGLCVWLDAFCLARE